jgi:WD40 repeat protein
LWVCAGRDVSELGKRFREHGAYEPFGGDGLPLLTDGDLREILDRECGRQISEVSARDRPDAKPGRNSNPFLDALVERSHGLPLYLRLLVQDIREGRLSFKRGEEKKLPRGLASYYERVLERLQISDVSAVLTPVFCILACAKAPLTFETILELMKDDRLIREGGEELLRNALEFGHLMLKRTVITEQRNVGEEGEPFAASAFMLYHESFRDHLLATGTVEFAVRAAQTSFVEFAKTWAVQTNDAFRFRYALRFGPSHLFGQRKWEDLRTILTDLIFIEAKCAAGMMFEVLDDYSEALSDVTVAGTGASTAVSEDLTAWYAALARHVDVCQRNPRLVRGHLYFELRSWAIRSGKEPAWTNALSASSSAPWMMAANNEKDNPIVNRTRAHDYGVVGLAISGNGEWLVSGGGDGSVYVWSKASAFALRTILEGPDPAWSAGGLIHPDLLPRVTISNDGEIVAAIVRSRQVVWWRRDQPATKHTALEKIVLGNPVLSAHGDQILLGPRDDDLSIVVLRLVDASVLDCLEMQPKNNIHPVLAATPDLGRVVIGGWGNGLWIWDRSPRDWTRMQVCPEFERIADVAISETGDTVVFSTNQKDGRVWMLRESSNDWLLYDLGRHAEDVGAVAVSSDRRWVSSAGHDARVNLWETSAAMELRSLSIPQATGFHLLKAIAIGAAGEVFVGGSDGVLYVIDPGRWPVTRSEGSLSKDDPAPIANWTTCADLNKDGLYAWRNSGGRLWIAHSNQEIKPTSIGSTTSRVHSISIARSSTRVALCQDLYHIGFARFGKANPEKLQIELHLGYGDSLSAIAISHDGRFAVAGCELGGLCLVEIKAGAVREVSRLPASRAEGPCPCRAVAINEDGSWIAAGLMQARIGDYSSDLVIWNGGAEVHRIATKHRDYVCSIAVCGNPPRIATGSACGEVFIWPVGLSELPIPVQEPFQHAVRSLDFHDSGQWLAAGGEDQWIRIYEVSSGRFISGLCVFGRPVLGCRFTAEANGVNAAVADAEMPSFYAVKLVGAWA